MGVITDDVVAVMTDSLAARKPLDLPLGSRLGEWEQQASGKLWLAEAGLYELETEDGKQTVWQRGFDRRNPVDVRGIVESWLTDQGASYQASYPVTRFIGMGLALVTNQPWRRWVTIDRKIEPVPICGTTKRLPVFPVDNEYSPGLFQQLQLRGRLDDTISYPYKNLTIDPQLVAQRLEDECNEE